MCLQAYPSILMLSAYVFIVYIFLSRIPRYYNSTKINDMFRIQRLLLFVFILFLGFHQHALAQSWEWAIGTEYKTFALGSSYTSPLGNTVFTGTYRDSIKIKNHVLVNKGFQRFFIAVSDLEGNISHVFSDGEMSASTEAYIYDVEMDKENNIIIGGVFYSGSINFHGVSYPCKGSAETFLAKYAPDGTLLWVKTFGSNTVSDDLLHNLVVDEDNNIYATGFFGNSPLELGDTTLNSSGVFNAFLVKYAPGGDLLWARTAEVSGNAMYKFSRGTCLALGAENIYWIGVFRNEMTFSEETISTISPNDENVFLISLSKDGAFNWLKNDGGDQSSDYARTVNLLADTMLLVTGYYQGINSSFAGYTLHNNPGDVNVHTGYYMAAYDINGNGKWAQPVLVSVGDEVLSSYGNIMSVVLDTELNAWLIGDYTGEVLLNGQTEYSVENSTDIFMIKYNTSLKTEMQRILVGDKKIELPWSIGIDQCDQLYSYGLYRDSVYFGDHLLYNPAANSTFLAKYKTNTLCTVTGLQHSEEQSLLLAVPNPAKHQVILQLPPEKGIGQASLYNMLWQEQQSTSIQLSDDQIILPLLVKPGMYMLQVITETKKYNTKLLVE